MLGAAIGMVLGIGGAVATWNKDLGPHWYPIGLIVEALPCAWIDGISGIAAMRTSASAC